MEKAVEASTPRQKALDKCDYLFEHFDTRARGYKKQYQRYTYFTLGLTSAVTVISALQALYKPSNWWVWLLPVASGVATFCASMVHATNAHELWLRARSMTHQLATEKFLFTQCAGDYAEGDEDILVKRFSKTVMKIWESGHSAWEKAIESQKGA